MLLDAGVNPATSDMCYIKDRKTGNHTPFFDTKKYMRDDDLPCWSMGALWEICHNEGFSLAFLTDEDSIETVMSVMVERLVKRFRKNQ